MKIEIQSLNQTNITYLLYSKTELKQRHKYLFFQRFNNPKIKITGRINFQKGKLVIRSNL